MSKRLRVIASLLVCVAVSGCLVPEKFVASVRMKPDGAYMFRAV